MTQIQESSSFDIQKIINRMVIFVSLGILAHILFLLFTTEKEILSNISKIKIPYLILIAFLALIPWLGHSLRLMLWTRFVEHPLKFKDCLKTAIYTELGGALSPTMIGGGPIKLGYLLSKGMRPGKAGVITALNGVEDFVMYSLILFISFIHVRESIERIINTITGFVISNVLWFLLGIAVVIIIRIFLKKLEFSLVHLLPERLRSFFKKFLGAFKEHWGEMRTLGIRILKEGKATFSLSFLILMLSWLTKFSILLVVLYTMGVEFKPFQMYLQQWIVYITMMFIPTPGASGGAEASFYLIFGGEIPKNLLPLIVSVWRFFLYYFMLFSAVIIIQIFSVSGWRKSKITKL